jgi:hypothetical protein
MPTGAFIVLHRIHLDSLTLCFYGFWCHEEKFCPKEGLASIKPIAR